MRGGVPLFELLAEHRLTRGDLRDDGVEFFAAGGESAIRGEVAEPGDIRHRGFVVGQAKRSDFAAGAVDEDPGAALPNPMFAVVAGQCVIQADGAATVKLRSVTSCRSPVVQSLTLPSTARGRTWSCFCRAVRPAGRLPRVWDGAHGSKRNGVGLRMRLRRGGCDEGNVESEKEREQDSPRSEHAARIGGARGCGKVSEVTRSAGAALLVCEGAGGVLACDGFRMLADLPVADVLLQDFTLRRLAASGMARVFRLDRLHGSGRLMLACGRVLLDGAGRCLFGFLG